MLPHKHTALMSRYKQIIKQEAWELSLPCLHCHPFPPALLSCLSSPASSSALMQLLSYLNCSDLSLTRPPSLAPFCTPRKAKLSGMAQGTPTTWVLRLISHPCPAHIPRSHPHCTLRRARLPCIFTLLHVIYLLPRKQFKYRLFHEIFSYEVGKEWPFSA